MAVTASIERWNKPRSGIALGGIGTGWFEIRHDGGFYNWNLFNNRPVARGPHFGFDRHSVLFFVLRIHVEGGEPCLRLLEIEESHGAAAIAGHEFHYIFPWLDGVDRVAFEGSVPFAKLTYTDRAMPLRVEMEAWSPLIPGNARDSSLPLAFFDFRVSSACDRPVTVSVLASLRNCVGYDTREKAWAGRVIHGAGYRAFEMGCTGMDETLGSWGTMSMASLDPDSRVYLGWGHIHPYYERVLRERELPEVDDLAARNHPQKGSGLPVAATDCWSTIGRTTTLARRDDTLHHRFAMTWDFPNRYARHAGDEDFAPGYLEQGPPPPPPAGRPHIEGHAYSNLFASAAEVVEYAARHHARLERESRAFHHAFFSSSLPPHVLDVVNAQLNTLRTSSWFTRAGDFGILEGLSPTQSFAGLCTTDVAMYGAVTASALFPDLDRASLRAHIRFQNPDGSVFHSLGGNFRQGDPREGNGHRLDLPGQFAFMALRAALWAGDRSFLAEVWPAVCAALEYVLRERDPNGDCLPDMEGVMCSYDNFPMHGVAPYVATQWLAAVSAATAAADILGDSVARARYADVLRRGAAALENVAWNGRYYRLSSDGLRDEGCLTDQIIGHWACRLAGLPPFLREERIHAALRQIVKTNYHPAQGLRNCQWPGDSFLHDVADDCWVDQANTCWSGVELAFASLLLFEGLSSEAFEIVANVDERYRRWGMYWDHQEFGGHYFRPMSAWALIPAALGFSLFDGTATFDPKVARGRFRLFFTAPEGYGHYVEEPDAIRIECVSGTFAPRRIRVRLPSDWPERVTVTAGVEIPGPDGAGEDGFLVLGQCPPLRAGDHVTIRPVRALRGSQGAANGLVANETAAA
jgi:uncharacterized protein (DUF608 family)